MIPAECQMHDKYDKVKKKNLNIEAGVNISQIPGELSWNSFPGRKGDFFFGEKHLIGGKGEN